MTTMILNNDTQILRSSRRLVYDGRRRDALNMLSEHLSTYPNDLIARVERAAIYMGLDQHADMNADLAKVMAQSPKSAVEYDAYGSALALQGFTGPISKSNNSWKRASAAFEKSIRLDPNRADVFRHRAQLHVWREDDRSALKDLDQALALTPNDIDLLWRRAYTRQKLGDKVGAIVDVNAMIRLEPDNAKFYLERQRLRDEEDHQGQLEDYSRALELSPNDVETLNSRALLYTIMEKRDLAVQDYERVLQLEPYNKDALIWSAYALADAGNHKLAIERFTQVIAMDPDVAAWYGHRAKSYRAIGDIAAAEADEQRQKQLKPVEDASIGGTATAGNETAMSAGDTQPGVLQFVTHYWLTWVWVGLALFTLVVLVGLLVNYTGTNRVNSSLVSLLTIGIVAALYRGFRNGFRFKRESAISEGGMTGLALNLVLWGIQIAVATVVWPFVELFRQGRFLVRAWNGWGKGEILVNEDQKPARGG